MTRSNCLAVCACLVCRWACGRCQSLTAPFLHAVRERRSALLVSQQLWVEQLMYSRSRDFLQETSGPGKRRRRIKYSCVYSLGWREPSPTRPTIRRRHSRKLFDTLLEQNHSVLVWLALTCPDSAKIHHSISLSCHLSDESPSFENNFFLTDFL